MSVRTAAKVAATAGEVGLRFIAYLHISTESPATFHKIQRLYKDRRETHRRRFIPLNFRDERFVRAAASAVALLPFRGVRFAFISLSIRNGDRFKKMEFSCDRAEVR